MLKKGNIIDGYYDYKSTYFLRLYEWNAHNVVKQIIFVVYVHKLLIFKQIFNNQ